MPSAKPPPSSILILGSGVFGLSTAYSLTQHPEFQNTHITLVDRQPFPAPDAASIDSSRIVRPDYPDSAYCQLAVEAQKLWRAGFGGEGQYTESGLCIVLDRDSDGPDGSGRRYMQGALENVSKTLGLRVGRKEEGGQVEVLDDEAAVKRVMGGMEGNVGGCGYVNWTSGWAHAENAMVYLRKLVESTGRVKLRTASIEQLLFSADRSAIHGAVCNNGEEITADLTILATGAWTPAFIDLRGIASASGQILSYIDLTPAEQERLGANPTLLNESSGMFIIQPRNNVLKVARHGYGYANPVKIPHPERPRDTCETITVSLPRTKTDDPDLNIPAEGLFACRAFLAKTIPSLADRPFTHTRICWYTDTPNSDWLIDYHPTYSGLFLATGGSGHAYKFLPVIGERIVDVLLRQDRDGLGKELRRKWRWPEEKFRMEHVWTDDWRGGAKGMVLDEEFGKA